MSGLLKYWAVAACLAFSGAGLLAAEEVTKDALVAKGEAALKAAPQLCLKCGELKGGESCCKPEGRETCEKCGLFAGSLGCCKIPKDAKAPVTLCTTCGEIKESDLCCKEEGRVTCPKCGLYKGSIGCCKLPVPEKVEALGEAVKEAAPKVELPAPVEKPKTTIPPKPEHPEHPR